MNDLRQRLIELRREIQDGYGLLGNRRADTLTEAIEELDRIERVREWAEGKIEGGLHGEGVPGYGEAMVDLGREVLSLLNTPPEEER